MVQRIAYHRYATCTAPAERTEIALLFYRPLPPMGIISFLTNKNVYLTMYFAILIPILVLLAWVIFRKKSKSGLRPLDPSLKNLLENHIDYYQHLSPTEKKRFESQIAGFLDYVHIEGVGTEISDLDRTMIASAAIIPIFGLGEWEYRNLTNIILYPDTFDPEYRFEGNDRNIQGMVGSGFMNG
jgi:hypothetical protein